jgi:hypothetical protein
MISKSLLTALAAGLLSASVAQAGSSQSAPTRFEHLYQGGPNTVVPHSAALAGPRAESREQAPTVSTDQNSHHYYGGSKYH